MHFVTTIAFLLGCLASTSSTVVELKRDPHGVSKTNSGTFLGRTVVQPDATVGSVDIDSLHYSPDTDITADVAVDGIQREDRRLEQASPSTNPTFYPTLSPTSLLHWLDGETIILTCNSEPTASAPVGSEKLKCTVDNGNPGIMKVIMKPKETDQTCAQMELSTATEGSGNGVTVDVGLSASDINDASRDEGYKVVVKKFCFRADAYSEENQNQEDSILADMWEITTTYKYAPDGTFEVDINTSEFSAEEISTSVQRDASVEAYHCKEDGEEFEGDSLSIGDILYICVKPNDDDVTLKVTELVLKSGETTIIAPISESGGENFLTKQTTIDEDSVQVVSTLMMPTIFDNYGNQEIVAAGKVEITYKVNRKLEVVSRFLQGQEASDERSDFTLSVNLSKEDKIVASGGATHRVFGVTFVLVVALVAGAFVA